MNLALASTTTNWSESSIFLREQQTKLRIVGGCTHIYRHQQQAPTGQLCQSHGANKPKNRLSCPNYLDALVRIVVDQTFVAHLHRRTKCDGNIVSPARHLTVTKSKSPDFARIILARFVAHQICESLNDNLVVAVSHQAAATGENMQIVTLNARSTARAATFTQVATSTTLCAIVCIALTACGQGPAKTTTTTVEAPDGTVTTKVESTDGSGHTAIDSSRAVESNQPIDPNNTTVIMGRDPAASQGEIDANTDSDGNSKVHVNMPGVHIDANEGSSKLDINVPFVHIHKDGSGGTHIKTPFVKINARED